MAIRGVSLAEREDYILREDPGHPDHPEFIAAQKANQTPDKPTTFFIGNLTRADRIEMNDMTTTPVMSGSTVSMTTQRTRKAYEVVRRGLKGWDNMLDAEGNPAKFETITDQVGASSFREVVSDTSMSVLSSQHIMELADAILLKNGMTEDMAKNFGSVSQPSGDQHSQDGHVQDAPTNKSKSVDAPPKPSQGKASS